MARRSGRTSIADRRRWRRPRRAPRSSGSPGTAPPLAAAQLVEARVGGDPVGPGGEGGPAVEAADAADDGDQRLLGGVERVGVVAGQPAADGVDPVVVAAQQRVEGGAVARLRRRGRAPGRRARPRWPRDAIPGTPDQRGLLRWSTSSPPLPSPWLVIQMSTAPPSAPPRSTSTRAGLDALERSRPARPSPRSEPGSLAGHVELRRPVVGGAGDDQLARARRARSAASTRPTPGLSTVMSRLLVALGGPRGRRVAVDRRRRPGSALSPRRPRTGRRRSRPRRARSAPGPARR